MRLVALLGIVVLAAGCGAGTRHVARPFTLDDGLQASGYPILEVGPRGTILRFIPSTSFFLGLTLHNRSGERITLDEAHVDEPRGTLVHQTGTSFVVWNPAPCSGNHSCPARAFPLGPAGAHAHPLALLPGSGAGVSLGFRLGSCAEVPLAADTAPRTLDVGYRYGEHGAERHELLALRSAAPHLRMPKPADCARRPHSTIALDGPFAGGSTWTIPGSSGDTCSRTAGGGLVFDSRGYQSPGKAMVRVRIVLTRFRGSGLYRTLAHSAAALGPAKVDVVAGIGLHGWTTFPASAAQVTVTRATPQTIDGRFRATVVTHRWPPFRAYGAWRCTVT